jgi:hypothetical protein
MSQPLVEDDVLAELARLWAAPADPSTALERLVGLLDELDPGHAGRWVEAVVHLAGPEHLDDPRRGHAVLDAATPRFSADDEAVASVQRGRAVLFLYADAPGEAEATFESLATRRIRHEAWALVTAARGAVVQGRLAEAAAWLDRGAKLSYQLADHDPLLLSLHAAALAMAGRLVSAGVAERPLRNAVVFARGTAERAGTWRDVQHAELLLAQASLLFGESMAAVAHAEVAAAMCRTNDGEGALFAEARALLERARAARPGAADEG